ncbi:hypothetical protein FRB96_000717 [Tulasnella sp. 330]|nr:hypothetical protein FRB96_000717 [Tulasnella sp. 330]KAG8882965.1 hypothetical protein FRB97_007452 [Tulasnella sp. 331]KAG8887166.1 hypothetical protein FRB98_000422 [Tulasnella sp. 332]
MQNLLTRQIRIMRIRPNVGTAGHPRLYVYYHHQAPRSRSNTNDSLQEHEQPSSQINQNAAESSAASHLPSNFAPPNLPIYKNNSNYNGNKMSLQRMFSANAQWAEDVNKERPDFFKATAEGQSPKLLWIGCADSRVPESIVMAAKPGDIFVHRNIANQFQLNDDSALSVLAYAVEFLHVENVAVVGHTHCGGAAACLDNAKKPKGPPSEVPLWRWLDSMTDLARQPKVVGAQGDHALAVLIEENVKAQVANVLKTETIQEAWRAGKKVVVHGWIYDIEKGQIRDLGISVGPCGQVARGAKM